VDIGQGTNGKRQQLTRTFDRMKNARAELSRIRHRTDQGMDVKPSKVTVTDYLDEYLRYGPDGRRRSPGPAHPRRLKAAFEMAVKRLTSRRQRRPLVASPEYAPEERPGSTPSDTPTSSADCSSGASSARSGCTTPGTPPCP